MTQRCFATGSGRPVYFLFISVSVVSKHRLDHDACRIAFAFPPSSTNSIVATRATEKKFHDLARVTLAPSLHSALTRMAPILRMLYAARNNGPPCSYAMCTSPKPTHIFRTSGRKWITEAVGTVHVKCTGLGNSDLTTPSCWNGIKTNPNCTSFETRTFIMSRYFFIDILVDGASSTWFLHFDLQLLVWHSYEVPFLYCFLEWRRIKGIERQ